jgi:hypothetical protein
MRLSPRDNFWYCHCNTAGRPLIEIFAEGPAAGTQQLVAKARESLAGLDVAGRLNDRQLYNLLTQHPSDVSGPLVLGELRQRLAHAKLFESTDGEET